MDGKILHWSYRDFYCFPEEILKESERLEEIYLKENFIPSLPVWLFELTNLKFINLCGNNITFIPDEISNLVNLNFFDISSNCLKVLPKSLFALINLERLLVSSNQLTFLPEEIGKLKSLRIFIATNNRLNKLPNELCKCENLEEINISGNENLVSLPNNLLCLPKLRFFAAKNCSLSTVPYIISNTLKHFFVNGNPHLSHFPHCYERFFVANHDSEVFYSGEVLDSLLNRKCHVVVLNSRGIKIPIKLPHNLLKAHQTRDGRVPPTLFELNLRKIIKTTRKLSVKLKNELPQHLFSYLENAPIEYCDNDMHKCQQPIILEGYLIFFKTYLHNSKVFAKFFCSKDCADNWWSKYYLNYIKLEWQILSQSNYCDYKKILQNSRMNIKEIV